MAKELKKANVDRMLRELTAKQFLEWEYYAQLEPFGELRADYRAASIASTIANVHRGKRDAYTLEDFRLKYEEPATKRTQTPEQQLAIAKMIAAAYSVKDKAV